MELIIKRWRMDYLNMTERHMIILILDLQLIVCTVIAIISKKNALKFLSKKLSDLGADENLVAVSSRNSALRPTPPPGSKKIVTTRD